MKTFTTPEYITPIIEEIKTTHTASYSPATLAALNCIVLLKKNRSRDALALRTPKKGGFFYWSETVKALYKDLESWTQAAETEPGELDRYMYTEHKRIQEAIRAALIETYSRTA